MSLGFNTRAIHAGQPADPATGAVVPPIHVSTTFEQVAAGEPGAAGYEYSRVANPTRTALQENLASLEGGTTAFSFASGLSAEDAFFRTVLRPGDHVVLGDDAYGGSYRYIAQVLGPWGIGHTAVDMTDLDAVAAAIVTYRPRVVRIESPSNPVMNITDVAAVTAVAHQHGALVLADNTFATPALHRPLEDGVDVVLHSTTKYLGGHSDVIGGALVTSDTELAERLGEAQNWVGAISSPFDCYLTLRGIKTLGVRMHRHSENALALAKALENHPVVERVLYPGLPSHPGHELAARQMDGFGGMVSLLIRGGEGACQKLMQSTEIFTLAPSLGGVESLIEHPGLMTHHSVEGTALEVPENLVRLSVGIEDIDDLVLDIRRALETIT